MVVHRTTIPMTTHRLRIIACCTPPEARPAKYTEVIAAHPMPAASCCTALRAPLALPEALMDEGPDDDQTSSSGDVQGGNFKGPSSFTRHDPDKPTPYDEEATDTDRDDFRTHLAGYFADRDLLVTPTLATPPVEAARWGQRSWPRVFAASARYAPYSAPWNHAGYPAVSVPAGVHPRTGTPLAVQLVAPDGGERLLLGVAALLERLAPWPRVPPASESCARRIRFWRRPCNGEGHRLGHGDCEVPLPRRHQSTRHAATDHAPDDALHAASRS